MNLGAPGGNRQCAPRVSSTQQRLSTAGLVPAVPRAADAADAGRRITARPPDKKPARCSRCRAEPWSRTAKNVVFGVLLRAGLRVRRNSERIGTRHPWRQQRDHLVLLAGAGAARQAGPDLRGELHHIQVPPRALRGMIVTPALALALRATHRLARQVLHFDVYQLLRNIQPRPLQPPRTLDAQQHTVMRRHRRLCFSFGHTLLNKINSAFATRKPEEPCCGLILIYLML